VRISALLEGKGASVATISGDATVYDAVAELRHHGVGALVVSSDGEHIDGIVSERDVVRWLSDRRDFSLEAPVASIMSPTVYTCSADDDTDTLMTTMTERRIRHVPVVRDDILCGS
jgi:CBS domain-containing protein